VDYHRFDVHLKAGETKTLTDEEAYAYLRKRDTKEFGTADRRLEREKQYALALYERLKEEASGDRNKAIDMYDELKDYIVTNIVFADVAEDLMKYGFDESNMYEIKGELVQGKNLEEFYIDKNALYDIIISILYKST
jgi:anionic cell wall polymer biosynthesis LytR-Cps2A-Psr (LCP) family protein